MSDPLPLADSPPCGRPCVGTLARRDFLFAAGATLVSLSLPGESGLAAPARLARYPRRKVARLSQLKPGVPVTFRYPWDHLGCESVLLMLGREAGGGIGPARDVVAFNALCPHMGWDIPARLFHADPGIAGPCPAHWTTFDLTRHGMVVSGHATQGLPQVVLELEGDDVLAVAVLGLIHGYSDNRLEPTA